MKTIPVYESSMRFARTVYGLLALIGFLTHNVWVILFCATLMTIGVIYPMKSNAVYEFHRVALRPLFKDKAKPILRGKDEMRFACVLGTVFLLGALCLIYLGMFIEIAWISVLFLSSLMLLSGFSGVCAATLFYVFFIKKFLLGWKKEEEILSKAKFGEPNYVNQDCIIAQSIGACPWERCQYCRIKSFKECPMFRFIVFTLILMILCLGIIFLIEKELFLSIYKIILFSLFFFTIAYGYLFNKTTIEVIETEREIQKKIEQAKNKLQARVDELERFHKLTIGREIKMVELKKKIKELEQKLEKE
ncbi:hypothetical protein AMJ49_06245 [Parcubacteria bacterium DG_74_2]|nr:MAG: hypothetical protein AMJ49_06245 [Parcubacteria bacterium DG_74_2]